MLTALELAGFKSFADKTRLDFHEGVTCVVGPNGSGKSNVVDAIKWVLGSQSPKSLRGSEMTDVIFNGSAGRRPLNAAEVTLEFDNRSRLFDNDAETIRVTRRVYRSGEGEYAINNAACRLKDIRELLAGTGVGTESYNIIEQGRVDAVLRASPKDRRALFEEAAGISRFRLKKQEATRRLARVDQNLLRLSDIVDEVEGRLRRVRMQAGKARRYREQSERLKELRTQLGLADWRVLTDRLRELGSLQAELSEQHQAESASVGQGERELEALEQGSDSAADRLAAAERELATLRERLAGHESTVASETARLAELEASLQLARRRGAATRQESRSANGVAEVETFRKRLEEHRDHLASATATVANAEQELAEIDARIAEAESHRVEAKTDRKAVETELGTLTREGDLIALRLEVTRNRVAEQEPLLGRIASDRRDAEEQAQRSREDLKTLGVRVAESERATTAARRRLAEAKEQLASAREQVARHQAEAAGRRTQLESLRQAETELGRLRDEIARVLPLPESGGEAAVHGMVADVLHVDFDTATMIEAVLGERAHDLVVDNGAALVGVLRAKAHELTVRARFQLLDAARPASAIDQLDLSGLPGVMGRADQFVEAAEEYAPLVRRLLGRTWIVDTLETAAGLADAAGRGLDFVTFAGEALSAGGEIVAGPATESAGVITRRKQAAALAEAIGGDDARGDELSSQVVESEKGVAAAANEVDQLEASQATLAARRVALAQQTAALEERSRRLAEEHQRVSSEQQSLKDDVASSDTGERAARSRRGALAAELERLDQRRAELENRLAALGRRRSHTAEQLAAARLEVSRHEQHAEILTEQHQQRRRDAAQQSDEDLRFQQEASELAKRVEQCGLSILNARAEIAAIRLQAERLVWRRKSLAQAKRGESDRRQQLARNLHQARRRAEAARSRLQQNELDAERLRLERAALAERMQEDYGIDLAAESQASGPALQPNGASETLDSSERLDRDAMERELSQLRSQVGSVGAVNLDSLEELDELEERFAELSSQYNDLSEAKTSLERLATRISNESRQLFTQTVEEVRGHFRELFRRLFGGGEADIVLLDAEGADPLDAGVEVAASPPGKELRSISLLSGGEKTMTCVALLLAVFRTKPSPFCVLDEVDAALDEANIGRFTGVLSEFLSSTQFIVVSHSKKTMTGADTLYGVTMQESGVSKQVAVRFEDVGEDGQIDPAATLRRAA